MDENTAGAAAPAKTVDEYSIDDLTRIYLKMRNKVQEMTKEMESKIEALKAQQDQIASIMKDRVRALGDGVSSLKTEHGTIMLTTKTRYYAQDWDAFKTFVHEHDALDLFEKRIAQKNMQQFIDENPGLTPPGLNSISEVDISVRKATAR